jgi:hypothetical protein
VRANSGEISLGLESGSFRCGRTGWSSTGTEMKECQTNSGISRTIMDTPN